MNISNNQFSKTSLNKFFETFSNENNHIQILIMEWCNIKNINVLGVSLKNNTYLQVLKLHRNNIQNIDSLGNLFENNRIMELDLSNNKIN